MSWTITAWVASFFGALGMIYSVLLRIAHVLHDISLTLRDINWG